MKRSRVGFRFGFLILSLAAAVGVAPRARGEIYLDKIQLPKKFHIEIYVKNLENPRSMTWGERGTLFVGTRGNKVYAITAQRQVYEIAKNLEQPNGVAFKDGSLYIATISKIFRLDKIESRLEHPPALIPLPHEYPSKMHHGWKFIAFGPDGKLYVPVGAPCNICEPDPPFASITRMNPDGTEYDVFARGIRNTVGFTWRPQTQEMWFTDNGRDLLGDDLPADELNVAKKKGLFFGYPYCHQGDVLDPKFGKGKKCSDYEAPALKLDPHGAALGLRFYTGQMFPKEYKNQIFIAEHGSWNRSVPIGYRILLVSVDKKGKAKGKRVFASGWLQGSTAWGRPVDVSVAPDGSLLVSDDKAGAIYRIFYSAKP